MNRNYILIGLYLSGLILAAGVIGSQAKAETVRSQTVVNHFKKERPCPSTNLTKGSCPGYVVDHIVPLACRGLDDPINMQWQSILEGKKKDRWERKDCSIWKNFKHQLIGGTK